MLRIMILSKATPICGKAFRLRCWKVTSDVGDDFLMRLCRSDQNPEVVVAILILDLRIATKA